MWHDAPVTGVYVEFINDKKLLPAGEEEYMYRKIIFTLKVRLPRPQAQAYPPASFVSG